MHWRGVCSLVAVGPGSTCFAKAIGHSTAGARPAVARLASIRLIGAMSDAQQALHGSSTWASHQIGLCRRTKEGGRDTTRLMSGFAAVCTDKAACLTAQQGGGPLRWSAGFTAAAGDARQWLRRALRWPSSAAAVAGGLLGGGVTAAASGASSGGLVAAQLDWTAGGALAGTAGRVHRAHRQCAGSCPNTIRWPMQ